MADTIVLYHYTTKDGRNYIRGSGVIKKSTKKAGIDDARYGDGVYLTSLPPTDGKIQLAFNNWDGKDQLVRKYVNWGRVDCYVKVKLPKKEVKKIDVEDGRDIYMYDGDLILEDAIEFAFGDVVKK